MASILGILTKDKSLENNMELVQQMALLKYLNDNNGSDSMLKFITAARVGNEVYQRVSKKRKVDEYRLQFIAGIVQYIKSNPKASQKAIKGEVERLLGIFILQLKSK